MRQIRVRHPVTKAVLAEFCQRFCPQGQVLWVSEDTRTPARISKKRLDELRKRATTNSELPNLVIRGARNQGVILVEVAGLRGLVNPARRESLRRAFDQSKLRVIIVGAFASRHELQKMMPDPPWGTSAWIADEPDRMIHFDMPPISLA